MYLESYSITEASFVDPFLLVSLEFILSPLCSASALPIPLLELLKPVYLLKKLILSKERAAPCISLFSQSLEIS